MKKNILIVCALWVEMKAVKQQIKKLQIPDISVSFFVTGVGNYNTLYQLQEYITQNGKPDFICNIGVCWKISPETESNIFQVYRIFNLANQRESLVPLYCNIFPLKSIASSEQVITDISGMQGEEYVDMESYGVDMLAKKQMIPHLILKQPLDSVSGESKNIALWEITDTLEQIDYTYILTSITQFLEKNYTPEPEIDFEFYKNHFWFTVSEQLIFIKNYHKLTAFWKDFEEFFKENRGVGKKEFLERIESVVR